MHAAAQAKVQRLQAAGDAVEKEILERAFWRARTQAVVPPVSAQITSTNGFIEREKKQLAAAEGSLRGCPESRRVHQSFGRGREALRIIAVAGEEFCRTCPSTSGRVPRIGERSPNAHEAEDLSSGAVMLGWKIVSGRCQEALIQGDIVESSTLQFDALTEGRPSRVVEMTRLDITDEWRVACSPRRGSFRPLLTKERTPTCSARYGLRGDRVVECSHTGRRVSRRGVRRLVSSDEEPLVSAARNWRWWRENVHRAFKMSLMLSRMTWHHIWWHAWKVATGHAIARSWRRVRGGNGRGSRCFHPNRQCVGST